MNMTEFEKLAVLFLSHQSQCLDWLCRGQDCPATIGEINKARADLERDITRVASIDTLKMLSANSALATDTGKS